MVRPLNLINHLTIGHTAEPTRCEFTMVNNVTMDGAPMVVDKDVFIPHRYTVLDPSPHPTKVIANPTNITVGGFPVATELSLLECGDIVQCISPSKTNIGEPVGTGLVGPVAGPRSNYNVYINTWPTITYPDTGLSFRYQAGDPDRGRSDQIRYMCRRGAIVPSDGYTELIVSGGGSEQSILNYAGEPFSRRSGCVGLPNWAKRLEEPIPIAIKIREVVAAKRTSDGNYQEISQLDPNVLSYEPERGIITGVNNYAPAFFVRLSRGRINIFADTLVIKFQPGFYFGGALRFPIEEKRSGVYVEQQEIKLSVAGTTNNCPE